MLFLIPEVTVPLGDHAMCTTCGEPLAYVHGVGIIGNSGVCRDPFDPTVAELDNEGLHLAPIALLRATAAAAAGGSSSASAPDTGPA